MLRDQPNHLQLLCEGQMFAKHGWDKKLSEHRWKVASTHSQHMWCMARTAPDGYIRLLAENCDSTSPVYFSIFEVRWGSQSHDAPGGACLTRGNLIFTRVMIVHVDHLAATKQTSITRDALARLSALNIVFQIDIMGGDFNAAVYRTYIYTIGTSLLLDHDSIVLV
eukprot:5565370-Amphidinium_carterae.2